MLRQVEHLVFQDCDGVCLQAGSGGVGPTILETSLLLAGEEVTAFVNNEKVGAPHMACQLA